MKKKIVLFFALCVAVVCAEAQNLQDVVFLKNGSIVRGLIIEQIPNVSLKIQTADGSVFAYGLDEVEKITKEQPLVNRTSRGGAGLKFGYRGFVDLGGTIGVGDYADHRVEFSTSHGIQVCPYFFIGGGFGLNYYFDSELFEIPVFAQLRSEFLNHRISPFFDLKIGYTVFDAQGFYMTPSVGCHFGFPRRGGVNISVGYTLQMLEYETYYYYHSYYGSSYRSYYDTGNFGGVSLKVSFDF